MRRIKLYLVIEDHDPRPGPTTDPGVRHDAPDDQTVNRGRTFPFPGVFKGLAKSATPPNSNRPHLQLVAGGEQ